MSVALTSSVRRFFTVRGSATIAVLILAWCGLWRDVSIANVLSGVVLSVVTLALGVGTGLRGGIRLWPMAKLVGVVFADLVESTIGVAREVITPGDGTDEAIIAVHLSPDARRHFLLLLVCVTLTPGTAVVDADPDTGAMYLHMLHHDRADSVRSHVHTLSELADQALPVRNGSVSPGGAL